METKRNFKQEVKDWWKENKKVIKTGGLCLLIGAFWGFVKGVNCQTNINLGLIAKIPNANESDDDFVYDETTVDDPELLELIRSDQVDC